MIHCVYLLYGNGKARYIGVSSNLEQRLKGHVYESYLVGGKSYPLPKSRWIRSRGGLFACYVLYRGTQQECYSMERVAIAKAKARGWGILNVTDGGDRPMPINAHPDFDTIRAKIKLKAVGRKVSQETRDKMSKSHRENPLTHLNVYRGKRADNANSRPVIQNSLSGEFVKRWECLKDAAESCGVKSASLCCALSGRQRTSGGFMWQYA